VRCEKKKRISPDGSVSGSKKRNRGYGGTYGGVQQSLHAVGIWSQAVGFVLVSLAGNWLQNFSFCFLSTTVLIKKYYKFSNFNATCKDNAAVNCINSSTHVSSRQLYGAISKSYMLHGNLNDHSLHHKTNQVMESCLHITEQQVRLQRLETPLIRSSCPHPPPPPFMQLRLTSHIAV
jgi:hypothetical protein